MPRVCLIDDHDDLREVASELLSDQGFEVETFASAEDALDAIRARAYDVIVTDVTLPGMSGLELAKSLRDDPKARATRLVALTGSADVPDGIFDHVLVKPFDPEELARVIGSRSKSDVELGKMLRLLAHELRTPLTPLRAYHHQLRRLSEKGQSPTTELVEKMDRQIERVVLLLDHLTDLGRATAGLPLDASLEAVDMRALVERTVQSVSGHQPKDAPLTKITVEGDGTRPIVLGDTTRLSTALEYLLELFVRSSQGAPVRIRTWCAKPSCYVQIESISSFPRERAFALALAKQIARMHGGGFEERSTAEGGNSILLSLPKHPESS